MEPHRYRVTFALAPGERDLLLSDLVLLADALTEADRLYLLKHPETPALAASGVSVREDPTGYRPDGEEELLDTPSALVAPPRGPYAGQRVVDPLGACAWAAAEAQRRGEPATVEIATKQGAYKPMLRKGDGSFEDVVPGGGWRLLRPNRHRLTFVTNLFDGPRDRDLSHDVLRVLLETLTRVDELYLARHPETPDIMRAGVLYMEEPPGQEDWQDVPTTLKMGLGDCLPLSTFVLRDDYTFVSLADVRPGDRIMGDGDWTVVTEAAVTGVKPILGLELDNGCVLRASPEHRLFTSERKEIRAKDVRVGDDLLTPSKSFPTYSGVEVDPRLDPVDAAWLVGTYIADGWHDVSGAHFSISGYDVRPKRRKAEQKLRTKAICESAGISVYWHRKHVAARDRALTSFMRRCGSRAPVKALPTMSWTQEQVRVGLLPGLQTDCSTAVSGTLTHGTTSPTLALQLRVLYRMLGQSVHIRRWTAEEHRGLGSHAMYRVTVRRNNENSTTKAWRTRASRYASSVRVRAIVRQQDELCADITTDSGRFYLPESDTLVHNCDDLACWLTARMRLQGVKGAVSDFSHHVMPNGAYLYHIFTRALGRVYDPSRWTGMR